MITGLVTRVSGTVVGAGFCVLGAYSTLGPGDAVGEVAKDRAFWFGLTLLLIGVIAIVSSWLVRDPDRIWCRPPRRWRKR